MFYWPATWSVCRVGPVGRCGGARQVFFAVRSTHTHERKENSLQKLRRIGEEKKRKTCPPPAISIDVREEMLGMADLKDIQYGRPDNSESMMLFGVIRLDKKIPPPR